MEKTILGALPSLFQSLGTAGDPAAEFYNTFQRAADDHDNGFVKKYDEDLNSTLIFAGLFSAVTGAFIVDVQRKLEPDFEEMNHALLKIVASAALGNVPTGADAALPEWKGPDSTVVHVQAILYASLSTTLLAAFVAMLGKQWLNRYSSVKRGPAVDRCRQRKRKMDGMMNWKFGLVMECLPLMLQAALLLLGYSLSNYLFFINRVVAGVVIGFLTFGLLFYLLIVSAATLSFNCPFQTPLSLILRFFIRFDNQRGRYLKRSKKWFGYILTRMTKSQQRQRSGDPGCLGMFGVCHRSGLGEHVELDVTNSHPLFERVDWDGYQADSDCVAWMFEIPMDIAVTVTLAGFIPEITWNADTPAIPLERLRDALFNCFDHSFEGATLKRSLRDHAYTIAKALIHVAIQRMCIGEPNEAIFASISGWNPDVQSYPELETTLGIIDRVFSDAKPIHWQNIEFTFLHRTWMGHILLYRAWDILGKGEPLPDYIRGFILNSFRVERPPSAQIVADCLFIIGLVLGIKVHLDDLAVGDKSREVNPQIDRIYAKLTETFRNPSPTTDEIDRALESMEIIAPLLDKNVAQKSYELFHVVMKAPVSPTYSQDKKWEASRRTIHGAYKWDQFMPSVGDPHDILTFLDHHFDLATGGENQDEPIQNALQALAYASGPDTIDALKRFDPTKPSFVSGICYALQRGRPRKLRMAALLPLALVGDRWFETPHPIMESDQMRSLSVDWASAVDANNDYTPNVQKAILATLFMMINSPQWRTHIVKDKLGDLRYFDSVPDDSQALRRCVDNPEFIDAIKDVATPTAMILWMRTLWLRYRESIPAVRRQLETGTEEVVRGRRMDLEMYHSAIEAELTKPENALGAEVAYSKKMETLRDAMYALTALKEG